MPTLTSTKHSGRSAPGSQTFHDSPPSGSPEIVLRLWTYRDYLCALAEREIGKDLRSKGDPADIVQDTFLDACRDFGAYHGSTEGEFRSWLRSILRNNARTFRRRFRDVAMRGVAREIPLDSFGPEADGLVDFIARGEAPHAEAIRREVNDRIELAVSSLPERQRLTLFWKLRQDKSFREIGEHLGCSGPNAYKIWILALDALRVRLEAS